MPTLPETPQRHSTLHLQQLEEQIQQHKKHLESRSYLARGIGQLTDVFTGATDSLKQLQDLDRDSQNAIGGNDYRINELNKSIAEAVKTDQLELTISTEINRYGGEFVKIASLFFPGKLGWIASGFFFAADRVNPNDRLGIQIADASLGALQGIGSKGIVTGIGNQPWNFATKGVVMGISNRLIDQGLNRQTYIDPNGNFSVASGLSKLGTSTFNPAALTTDVVVFGVGLGAGSLIGKLAPSVAQSRLYSTMATGGAFGIASGAIGEVNREIANHEPISLAKIMARSAAEGIVSSVAAVPAGLQAESQYQSLLRDMREKVVELQPMKVSTDSTQLLTHERVQAEQIRQATDMPGENGVIIHAQPGDWKVTDPEGHTYAVSNDAFSKKYAFTGDGVYEGDGPVRAEKLTHMRLMRDILDDLKLAYPGDWKITKPAGYSYLVQDDFRMDYSFTGNGQYATTVSAQEIPEGTILKTVSEGDVVSQSGDRLVTAQDGTQTRVPANKIDSLYDWSLHIKADPNIPKTTLEKIPPQLMPPLKPLEPLHGWPAVKGFIISTIPARN